MATNERASIEEIRQQYDYWRERATYDDTAFPQMMVRALAELIDRRAADAPTSKKDDLGPYELEIGLSRDEREVIINHPEMTPTPGGRGGHIVFSPQQARDLAARLIDKANACVGERARLVTLAAFIWNQVALADRPPPGCIQLNNEEATRCAEALEALVPRAITTVGGLERFPSLMDAPRLDTAPELDRCKHCGHEAAYTDGAPRGQNDNFTLGVECSNTSCGIRTPEHYKDRASAAVAWNRTATAPPSDGPRFWLYDRELKRFTHTDGTPG
jgi:hypothetical protein